MLTYLIRRFMIALGTVWAISILTFVIIQLPPGDYVTSYIAQLEASGDIVTDQEAENLRRQYGLDQPVTMQYVKWVSQIMRGNFGMSMEWRRPVGDLIGERLALTVLLRLALPWHVGLWYLTAGLRQALEIDCDRRVARAEGNVERSGVSLVR